MKKFLVVTMVVLVFSLLAVSASAAARPLYESVLLPLGFTPTSINNHGVIAGAFEEFPAVWSKGRIIKMPFTARGIALAINNRGSLVVQTEADDYLLVDSKGRSRIIAVPGYYGVVVALNDRDQVIGATYSNQQGTVRRCFLWQAGRVTFLNDTGYWWLYDINNRGQILGNSGFNKNFVIQNNRFYPLATFGDDTFTPRLINDRGQIAGFYAPYDGDTWSGEGYPALYERGRLVFLKTLGQQGNVVAINNRGDILGYTEEKLNDGIEHLVLWRPGQAPMYVEERVSQPFALDPHYLVAQMNDQGQIVCNGFLSGQYGYFLLQPKKTSNR